MNSQPFTIYKLLTMRPSVHVDHGIATLSASRVSKLGSFLRRNKLDELPQLFNILIGNMSFVGPRPDVSGYYDQLPLDVNPLSFVKPGITSIASLYYRNEESTLCFSPNPKHMYQNSLFPHKVCLDLLYASNRSFFLDLRLIILTIFPLNFRYNLPK